MSVLPGGSPPLPPKHLRCKCGNLLDELRANTWQPKSMAGAPGAASLFVQGTNHKPDGGDKRAKRSTYAVEARPGSVRIDRHKWTCRKCESEWLLTSETLDGAYLAAVESGRPEVRFGVDVVV